MTHQLENLGHGTPDGIAYLLVAEETLNLVAVGCHPFVDGGKAADVGGLVQLRGEYLTQLVELFYHRGDDEIEYAADD